MGSLTPNPSSLRPPNDFLSSSHSIMGPGKGDPESPRLWRESISMSVFHCFLCGHRERLVWRQKLLARPLVGTVGAAAGAASTQLQSCG